MAPTPIVLRPLRRLPWILLGAAAACSVRPPAHADGAATPARGALQAPAAAGSSAVGAAPVGTASAFVPGQLMQAFDGGLKNGWQDWGWAHRKVTNGSPAELNLSKYAGWILGNHALVGSFTELRFDVQAPAEFGAFFEVRLGAEGAPDDAFARVPVATQSGAGGFVHVALPMAQLNPQGLEFDRIVFRANKGVGTQPVRIDHVALVTGAPGPHATGSTAQPLPFKPVKLRIRCQAKTHPIDDGIYGIAFSPRKVGKDDAPFAAGATVRRWGGNPASRYNWKLGNAWNTASDWFFKNVNYTDKDDYSWRDFLDENEAHGLRAAITLPTMGWVAKDTTSYSFSEAALGKQKYAQNDAGNGVFPDGRKLKSPPPETTSVAAPPAFVAEWVKELQKVRRADGHEPVFQYILDNEPALWNSTHRDVHPAALTYDELLLRTVQYGEAVRAVAPNADIAGPAEWGWPAYFFSAADQEAGFRAKPDRRAHGDTPLLAWLLQNLRRRAEAHGSHVLNTLDVHFYPQVSGVYGHGESTTPQGAAKRLRATRSLWDKTWVDESWIADKIALLPRLQDLIDENYPGRRISIGEYNFGGERHISGGLALAESLGRFAQANVRSAYLWTYPPEHSFAQAGFWAFRNYDGQGATFERNYVPTQMAEDVSLFASRNETGDRLVAVALNLRADANVDADVELEGCGDYDQIRSFVLDGQAPKLTAQAAKATPVAAGHVAVKLDSYSLQVIELSRRDGSKGGKAGGPARR